MKYCPKCGFLLDGVKECSCGFVYDEDVDKKEISTMPDSSSFRTGMMIPDDFFNNQINKIDISDDKDNLIEDDDNLIKKIDRD